MRPLSRTAVQGTLLTVGLLALTCGGTVDPKVSALTPSPRIDVGAGIRVHVPPGWHRIGPPVSGVSHPSDRLLLTSYPTRPGGNCSPERAQQDLPRRGALIYLFEYRPSRGDPWTGLRRRDFPRRPRHFRLPSRSLQPYECWSVPSYLVRFRAADRPFQLHVVLGPHAAAARRAQVRRILDSLRFAPLPPPPPDPYAGWRELVDETGDTLRSPPGWPAGVTTSPRRYTRPRALFFASNARLPGLRPSPSRGTHVARRLPSPLPAGALDALPPSGVLLWILENRKGPAAAGFPPLPNRPWPLPADFQPIATGPALRWPALRWERAAIAAGRHRFSVWIISGRTAALADRDLARKAAAAFAFSTGGFRDTPCRRGCRTG